MNKFLSFILEDYLNPIQKDVSVHESGLRSDFYVTEIDPIELGIQVEEEVQPVT